jgi:hypothetical protein
MPEQNHGVTKQIFSREYSQWAFSAKKLMVVDDLKVLSPAD